MKICPTSSCIPLARGARIALAPCESRGDDLSEEEQLVVVLNDIPFMDATCLSTLLGGIRRFRANGGTVVVVCGKGSLTRLLHTSGLDSVAAVAESYGQALKLLRDLDK